MNEETTPQPNQNSPQINQNQDNQSPDKEKKVKTILIIIGILIILLALIWAFIYSFGERSERQTSIDQADSSQTMLVKDNADLMEELGLTEEAVMTMSDDELKEKGFVMRDSVRDEESGATNEEEVPTSSGETSEPQTSNSTESGSASEPTPPPPATGSGTTPSPTPTPGAGSTGSGGAATSPAPPVNPTAQQQSDVTITRRVSAEPTNALPASADINLFQFKVESPHEFLDFEEAIFSITLGNQNLSAAADDAFQNAPTYHLEKLVAGSWQRLLSNTYRRYSGNIRNVFYLFDFGERIETEAEYRFVVSGVPCELAGNSIDVSILDSRNNVNLLFDTPTTDGTTDIDYTEQANPVQIGQCPVQSATLPPTNASVWLKFEEQGGTLFDSSGNGYDASTFVGLAYGTPALLSNAIRFNLGAGSTYAEIPTSNAQALAFADPLTVEFLMNADKLDEWQGLVSKGNGANQYDYHIALTPNNKIGYYTEQEGGAWYEGETALQKNAWYYITVTVGNCTLNGNESENCELKMYVNGREENVVRFGGNTSTPTPDQINVGAPSNNLITLGAWSGAGRLFSYAGFMDELVIYNRVLSASEILDRYRATR